MHLGMRVRDWGSCCCSRWIETVSHVGVVIEVETETGFGCLASGSWKECSDAGAAEAAEEAVVALPDLVRDDVHRFDVHQVQ